MVRNSKYPAPKAFIFLFLLLFGASACQLPPSGEPPEVYYRGALRDFMHRNDLSAKVDLDTLRSRNNLFALGALEALRGEVLIWNGQPLVSFVRDSQLIVDRSFDHRAALLVWAQVSHWEGFNVPESIREQADLEAFIAEQAKQQGLDAESAFPLRLRGRARRLQWHVIDWPADDDRHTHEKHRTSGPNGVLTDAEVEVLGFYSTAHTAIFTHHDTHAHFHFFNADTTLAGHVDALEPGEMVLFLPID